MMDKKFYAIAVSAICAMNVYAGPVDVNKAQTMARKFIGNPVSVGPSVVQSRGPRTSEPSLHLFNNQDGEGFVIVAGDDRVGGVLGYSDRGRLDAENMSAPMKRLLERYARVVELVKVDSISVTPVYAKPPKASVKPLVSAEWSQDYPYNYYTPRSSTSGKPTYTGCTITAMAQVLYAHRWPKMRPEGVTGVRVPWHTIIMTGTTCSIPTAEEGTARRRVRQWAC